MNGLVERSGCACLLLFLLTLSATAAGLRDAVSCRVERLVSARGEEERYAPASPKDAKISFSAAKRTADAADVSVALTNVGKEPDCFRLTLLARVPLAAFEFWNGYLNQIAGGRKEGEGICAFFPAIAALGKAKSYALGLNPRCLAPDVHGACERTSEGAYLTLSFPVYLDPKETFSLQAAFAACPARYRWHDVVERWYELFPKEFAPAEGIHPAAASAGCSYLYWNYQSFGVKDEAEREALLKRNYGKFGCWDWCYKPFVRAGDWAISDQWSVGWKGYSAQQVEEARQRTAGRLAPAKALNVAPMWYLNVCWTEEELWRDHFPGIVWAEQPEIAKFWSQKVVKNVYCGGDTGYNRLFREGIRNVPLKFPDAKGIAWDSCFGNIRIPERNEGFAGTRPRGHERGVPYAQEGIGISALLDYNHEQFSGPHRMANALNYKLVAPWFVAVRGDSGLYEGTPMTKPERFWRLESMRCRFGPKKFITWHKMSDIATVDAWAHIKDLPPDERDDAHRQIIDDNLFLSYYWGTVPAPLIMSENRERWVSAVPELVHLISRGWHPSPAADAPKGILLARYGEGAGTRLAVINPSFEARDVEITFPKEYWKTPVLGSSCKVTVPPRDIVILAPDRPPRPAMIAPYVPAKKIHEPGFFHWMDRSNLLDTWKGE